MFPKTNFLYFLMFGVLEWWGAIQWRSPNLMIPKGLVESAESLMSSKSIKFLKTWIYSTLTSIHQKTIMWILFHLQHFSFTLGEKSLGMCHFYISILHDTCSNCKITFYYFHIIKLYPPQSEKMWCILQILSGSLFE